MKLAKKTTTWSARAAFMAIKSVPLSDAVGVDIKVVSIATGTDLSADSGQEIATGYLLGTILDGGKECTQMFSTISKTAISQLDALIDMEREEGNLDFIVTVCEQQCKKDQKQSFIYLDFAD